MLGLRRIDEGISGGSEMLRLRDLRLLLISGSGTERKPKLDKSLADTKKSQNNAQKHDTFVIHNRFFIIPLKDVGFLEDLGVYCG